MQAIVRLGADFERVEYSHNDTETRLRELRARVQANISQTAKELRHRRKDKTADALDVIGRKKFNAMVPDIKNIRDKLWFYQRDEKALVGRLFHEVETVMADVENTEIRYKELEDQLQELGKKGEELDGQYEAVIRSAWAAETDIRGVHGRRGSLPEELSSLLRTKIGDIALEVAGRRRDMYMPERERRDPLSLKENKGLNRAYGHISTGGYRTMRPPEEWPESTENR